MQITINVKEREATQEEVKTLFKMLEVICNERNFKVVRMELKGGKK